ncbi:MAG TPA: hypothetical protein VGJ95_02155 [Pseudonocardiaceae bacterium]
MLLTAPAASAGPVQNAVAGLRANPVFLDPSSRRLLDVAAVRAAIGPEPIKIAVLPAGSSTSEVRTWPREIAKELPGNTIAVISGRYFYAGSEVLCSGLAGQAATNAIAKHNTDLDADANSDLTAALVDFVGELKSAPKCTSAGGAGRGDRYADEPGGGEAFGTDDTASVLPWVLGGLTLGVLGVGSWVLLSRRRARGRVQLRRGEARELVARLGAELAALQTDGAPGADPAGRQARADAAGKHGEAQALLVGATTNMQYTAVRHAAIEGLTAAAAARALLGRGNAGHGAPIPAFDEPAGAATAKPSPQPPYPPYPPLAQYAPGSPYYHPGSAAAPAGWYREPFWELSTPAVSTGHSTDHQAG